MTDLRDVIEQMIEALEPFADFADTSGVLPDDHVITRGSRMAQRQLTMGDCRRALAALATLEGEG